MRLLCICGPSGVGKGTMIELLMREHAGRFGFAVSHTTRAPRPGELNGRDYLFVSRADMLARIGAGEFVETAEVHGNMYGTSHASLVALGDRIPVLDLDVQGVRQVKLAMPKARVFGVLPPSMDELELRLRARGTDSDVAVQRRLQNARTEIAAIPELADKVVVNHSSWTVGYPALKAAIRSWFDIHLKLQ